MFYKGDSGVLARASRTRNTIDFSYFEDADNRSGPLENFRMKALIFNQTRENTPFQNVVPFLT
jgi:hypothetical protein